MKYYKLFDGSSDVLGGAVCEDNFILLRLVPMGNKPWQNLQPGESMPVIDMDKLSYTLHCIEDNTATIP